MFVDQDAIQASAWIKIHASQDCPTKIDSKHSDVREPCSSEVGARQIRKRHNGAPELHLAQISSAQVHITQVETPEVRSWGTCRPVSPNNPVPLLHDPEQLPQRVDPDIPVGCIGMKE